MVLQEYLRSHDSVHLEELGRLVRFETVGGQPGHEQEMDECAAWLCSHLEASGFHARVLQTPEHPVIIAERLDAGPDAFTVLVYGHYDVQPVEPLELWTSPPFELTERDGALYARGAADMKGNLLIYLQSLRALHEVNGGLPCNVRVLIEGNEESNPYALEWVADHHSSELKADAVVIADGGIAGPDDPSVTVGVRGMAALRVTVTTASHDLHSGQYGGAVPNAAAALARLLASLHDDDGRVSVDGFYDAVVDMGPGETVDSEAILRESGASELVGDPDYTPGERIRTRPTLEIVGIEGGYVGDGLKTIVVAQAQAVISCRLVLDQDPIEIIDRVTAHLQAHAPKGATVEIPWTLPGAWPARSDSDRPAATAALAALAETWGRSARAVSTGGSLPAAAILSRATGAPFVNVAFSLPTSRAHAPDEHLPRELFERGHEVVCRMLNAGAGDSDGVNETNLGPTDSAGTEPVTELAGSAEVEAKPAEEPLAKVLDAEGVTVTTVAGAQILRDVSLTVNAEEVLAVVGESGCGKSTFAAAVTGLLPAGMHVGGRISVAGENLVGTSERRLRTLRGRVVGFVPQDHIGAFNPVMTIERHLTEGPRTHLRLSRRAARGRALELLEMVDLDPTDQLLKSYPHQLSGGMRQRVMIAAAMACGPRLIVADEPTTALDVTVEASIMRLLAELCRTQGIGLILISHDLSVVAQVADRVTVLYAGEVVESGPTKALLSDPRHPYTEALLEAVPDPEDATVRWRPLRTIRGRPPDIADRPLGCWFHPRCPYAGSDDRCANEHPELREIEPGRLVRTFHPRDAAVSAANDIAADGAARYRPVSQGNEAVLRVIGVTKRYGRPGDSQPAALEDVSIEILAGETFGLIGGSGSGKSTLAQCILQLNGEYNGRIEFQGQALESLSRTEMRGLRTQLQVIFQDARNSLDGRLTVRASIGEALRIHEGRSPQRLGERVSEALAAVGLPEAIGNRYPRQCSGGELQRVCIARALILKPRLLICDEAVSSLDVSTRAQILNLLRHLQEDEGISMLFITHDFGPVAAMSDKIGVLNRGRLVECGAAEQVLRAPTDAYTRQLIASVPRLVEGALPASSVSESIPTPRTSQWDRK